MKPDYSDCMYNIANLYAENGDTIEAEKLYKQALRVAPKAIYYNSLGVLYHMEGDFDNSKACHQKAITIEPNYHACLSNLALVLLSLGDYEKGLNCYEHRRAVVNLKRKNFNMPIWRGEDLKGKTIVVMIEQGNGDNIQFIRFAENLKEMGAQVILHCQEVLVKLMQTCPWIDDIKPTLQALSDDYYIFSGSLMQRLHINLDNIPLNVPYLFADQDKVNSFKNKFFNHKKRKIGIISKGSNKHINDHNRSIALSEFTPLFELDNIEFYSLNFPSNKKALKAMKGSIVDLAPWIKDFSDTAAIIENLDLLISVDTAAVHIAGAMNKPCWLLVSYVPDWRWLLKGEKSLWYKSLRLFRQAKKQDWSTVINDVYQRLFEGESE